jgi:hypothetical protein
MALTFLGLSKHCFRRSAAEQPYEACTATRHQTQPGGGRPQHTGLFLGRLLASLCAKAGMLRLAQRSLTLGDGAAEWANSASSAGTEMPGTGSMNLVQAVGERLKRLS